MLKLSDKQSEDAANSPIQTIGHHRRNKPVGILTEIDREESTIDDSPARLVPPGYMGDANVTVERVADDVPAAHSNGIYATRHYAVHYVSKSRFRHARMGGSAFDARLYLLTRTSVSFMNDQTLTHNVRAKMVSHKFNIASFIRMNLKFDILSVITIIGRETYSPVMVHSSYIRR